MENSSLKPRKLWPLALFHSLFTAALVLGGLFMGYKWHEVEMQRQADSAPKPLWKAEILAMQKNNNDKFSPQEADAAYQLLTGIRRISNTTSMGVNPVDYANLVQEVSDDVFKQMRLIPSGDFKEAALKFIVAQNDGAKYWGASIGAKSPSELSEIKTIKNPLSYYAIPAGLTHGDDVWAEMNEEDRTLLIQKIWTKANTFSEQCEIGFDAQLGPSSVANR